MNDVRYYRDLLTNEQRVSAFREAIRATVRPGDRVLDVGTGLGTYAFFAADAGAARVYAVEGDPIVHVARTIGRLAGYADRVTFIRGQLPDVTPPERVDVIVFEDFPVRFVDPSVARLLTDVWAQWAEPNCRVVPRAATLYAAPVRSPVLWRRALSFPDTEVHYRIDWLPSREYAANTPLAVWMDGGDLAAAPAVLASVTVTPRVDGAQVGGRATWTIPARAAGTIHGLAYWFALDLSDGVVLSNAPGDRGTSWGQLFLPFDPPLPAGGGDTIHATVGPESLGDGAPGWLRWEAECGTERRRGHEFQSAPASLPDLTRLSPDGKPALNPRGARDARVLQLVDGRRSVAQIAEALVAEGSASDVEEAERLVAVALEGKISVAGPSIGSARR